MNQRAKQKQSSFTDKNEKIDWRELDRRIQTVSKQLASQKEEDHSREGRGQQGLKRPGKTGIQDRLQKQLQEGRNLSQSMAQVKWLWFSFGGSIVVVLGKPPLLFFLSLSSLSVVLGMEPRVLSNRANGATMKLYLQPKFSITKTKAGVYFKISVKKQTLLNMARISFYFLIN